MKGYLSIEEITKRKHFEHIDIIAGKEGLSRFVKWIHVVEVIHIRNLLKGDELILTTGLGFKDDEELFLQFLEQLIECGAGGLCLEMGTNTTRVPLNVIKLANAHQFPIILFTKEVRFVEITQDIHATLINQQYQMIADLERYSQQLNMKLLEMNDYDEILSFCQFYLGVQVVAQFADGNCCFYPELSKEKREELLHQLKKAKGKKQAKIAKQSVSLLGSEYGEVSILSNERNLNDYDYLILDRTVTALAQHLLRTLYIEERKHVEESQWMMDWLDGLHNEEEIHEHLAFLEPGLQLNGAVVCVGKFQPIKPGIDTDRTYVKLWIRTIFEQFGFHLFTLEVRADLVFILGNKRSCEDWKERVEEVFKKVHQHEGNGKRSIKSYRFGIGKYKEKLTGVARSYQSAREALSLKKRASDNGMSMFYDDLHLYRILSVIHEHADLDNIVTDYLAPVIDHDKRFNGHLLETLKAYLSCSGSKQETAKRLFIVRQTLYHRIEKLENLLGADFMQGEKRLALELMLLAKDYLNMDEQLDREPFSS
ncbi:PucR family transcriptional regulator [Bacillus sp. FJAT-45037]|uniref:PucR family transcriptional regulator n=1 Tax=Bacillus sp. FJAT-45037 TaxID=2011007 RepID=UPI000C246261|nr:PucR family transcriptional regulator [Bacillus sp. FJAT-45037]